MIHLDNAQLSAADTLLEAFKTLEDVLITAQTNPTIWKDKGLPANCGLCDSVRELLAGKGDDYTLFKCVLPTISTTWAHFTGSYLYPVPHPDTLAWERDQYNIDNAASAYNELPLYTGAYGELRLSLLRHWITELQGAINKHAI